MFSSRPAMPCLHTLGFRLCFRFCFLCVGIAVACHAGRCLRSQAESFQVGGSYRVRLYQSYINYATYV